MTAATATHELVLTGLDGGNPLGFLAALGTLRSVALARPDARPLMSWRFGGAWRPVLRSPFPDAKALAVGLFDKLKHYSQALEVSDDPGIPAGLYREKALKFRTRRSEDANLLAALASDGAAATNSKKKAVCQDTAFRTMGGQGHQHMLQFARNICAACTAGHLERALFQIWCYDDPVENHTLRWDPVDDVRYALRWRNPSGDPARKSRGSVCGANRLAIEALPLLPCIPQGTKVRTVGFLQMRHEGVLFRWPIWQTPLSLDGVRTLLTLRWSASDDARHRELLERGVVAQFASRRVNVGRFRNFTPAKPV